jgi:hypothetical protein
MTATQKRKTRKHLKNKKGGDLPGPPVQEQQKLDNNVAQEQQKLDNMAPVAPPASPPPPNNVVQSSALVQPAPAQRNWFSWEWKWKWPFGSKSGGSRRTHRKRASRHKTHRKHNK